MSQKIIFIAVLVSLNVASADFLFGGKKASENPLQVYSEEQMKIIYERSTARGKTKEVQQVFDDQDQLDYDKYDRVNQQICICKKRGKFIQRLCDDVLGKRQSRSYVITPVGVTQCVHNSGKQITALLEGNKNENVAEGRADTGSSEAAAPAAAADKRGEAPAGTHP